YFFFFNATATTEIYTLSYTTLFRSQVLRMDAARPAVAEGVFGFRPGEFKPLARHELARHVGPRAPEHDRQRLNRVLGEGFAQHRKDAAAGGVPATACSG